MNCIFLLQQKSILGLLFVCYLKINLYHIQVLLWSNPKPQKSKNHNKHRNYLLYRGQPKIFEVHCKCLQGFTGCPWVFPAISMEKGCKNHRESLYSSQGNVVYVVGKPCNIDMITIGFYCNL